MSRLSQTSKMPCKSWGIPAELCHTGSVLRGMPGSVCSKCYARKGRYLFKNVRTSLYARLNEYNRDPDKWVGLMVRDILGQEYFRWFDTGDLQSMEMLSKIVQIAELLPGTKFRLPTKERFLVTEWVRLHGEFPSNLFVTVSLSMLEQIPRPGPKSFPEAGVSSDPAKVTCPAWEQDGKCKECRKCWSKEDVVYMKH